MEILNNKIYIGAKCLVDFGEGDCLRYCIVTNVNHDKKTFTVEANGLGWIMSNIPFNKFKPDNEH